MERAEQVGGDHYNTGEYQHWDFACEFYVHPMIYAATKYMIRYHLKGRPVEDLRKAISYLRKYLENPEVRRDIANRLGFSDMVHMETRSERLVPILGSIESADANRKVIFFSTADLLIPAMPHDSEVMQAIQNIAEVVRNLEEV